MLYDKRWDKPEAKADVFSLEGLIAWLEKQPAKGEYVYSDPSGCMLCEYFASHGYEEISLARSGFFHAGSPHKDVIYPEVFADIANEPGARTYGQALSRARAAFAK